MVYPSNTYSLIVPPENNNNNSGNSNSGGKWWQDALEILIPNIDDIILSTQGQGQAPPVIVNQEAPLPGNPPKDKTNNTIWWIVGAIVFLLLIVFIVIMIMRSGKSQSK